MTSFMNSPVTSKIFTSPLGPHRKRCRIRVQIQQRRLRSCRCQDHAQRIRVRHRAQSASPHYPRGGQVPRGLHPGELPLPGTEPGPHKDTAGAADERVRHGLHPEDQQGAGVRRAQLHGQHRWVQGGRGGCQQLREVLHW